MKTKLNWLEAALLVTPFLVLAAFWNELPAHVPVHWNIHGQIDGWASKAFGLLLLPLVSLGTIALLHVLPRLDPRLRSTLGEHDRMHAVLQILRLALAAFFAVIFYMQIAAAFGHTVAAGRIVFGSVLLLLAVMGNYLANLHPNYFAGIRTPWTLESPATWRATHRLGGRLLFFGSISLLVLQFFLSENAFGILFVTSILSFVVWGFWYSWHHFHTHAAAR